jgi:hypothetical protein
VVMRRLLLLCLKWRLHSTHSRGLLQWNILQLNQHYNTDSTCMVRWCVVVVHRCVWWCVPSPLPLGACVCMRVCVLVFVGLCLVLWRDRARSLCCICMCLHRKGWLYHIVLYY